MATPPPSQRIGVVSDTHGLLRPRVLELLAGCSRILHAGDVLPFAMTHRQEDGEPA